VLHVMRDEYALILGDDVTIGHSVTLHGCTIESRCLVGMGRGHSERRDRWRRQHRRRGHVDYRAHGDPSGQLGDGFAREGKARSECARKGHD